MPLVAPKGLGTRPTSEKVRAAVFNSLGAELAGAHFLDLFAGAGAMGLEAVSRGCRGAVFVEQDREAVAAIKANVQEFQRRFRQQDHSQPPPPLVLFAQPVEKSFKLLAPHAPFDLVWLDPPYAQARTYFDTLGPALLALTTPAATMIYEANKADADYFSSMALNEWQPSKQKRYGDTVITQFCKRGNP